MEKQQSKACQVLPEIPQKRYFTISEAAKLCDVKTHVLRYWEQEFSAIIKPQRRSGRRYYLREEVIKLREVRQLLYAQGYTVQGAKQQLRKNKKEQHAEACVTVQTQQDPTKIKQVKVFQQLLAELELEVKKLEEYC